MSLADFKDLITAVQNLVLTIAIVVGGIWTFYTFIRLRYIQKAKAELRELEQKTRELAVLEINLEAVQLETGDNGPRLVSVTAGVKNSGNRNVYLDLQVACWSIARVIFDPDGRLILKDERTVDFDFEGHWVRVGGVVRLPTVLNVPERGIYQIEFTVPVSPTDVLSPSQSSQAEETVEWLWAGRKYVAVV